MRSTKLVPFIGSNNTSTGTSTLANTVNNITSPTSNLSALNLRTVRQRLQQNFEELRSNVTPAVTQTTRESELSRSVNSEEKQVVLDNVVEPIQNIELNTTPNIEISVEPSTVSEIKPSIVSEMESSIVSEMESSTVLGIESSTVPEIVPTTVIVAEPTTALSTVSSTVSNTIPSVEQSNLMTLGQISASLQENLRLNAQVTARNGRLVQLHNIAETNSVNLHNAIVAQNNLANRIGSLRLSEIYRYMIELISAHPYLAASLPVLGLSSVGGLYYLYITYFRPLMRVIENSRSDYLTEAERATRSNFGRGGTNTLGDRVQISVDPSSLFGGFIGALTTFFIAIRKKR